MKTLTRSLLLVGLAAFGMAGCGDDVQVVQPAAGVNSVTVTPNAFTLRPGGTIQLDASVSVSGTPTPATTVTWLATGGVATVSATGLVTAGTTTTTVPTTITATSTVDPSKHGAAVITVSPAAVASVTVAPNPVSVKSGRTTAPAIAAATQQFTSVVNGDAGVGQAVTWSVAPAGLATISTTGLLTANATCLTGNVVVSAASTVDATKIGVASVAITPCTGVGVISVVVGPVNPTIIVGGTVPLQATVTADPSITDLTVVWRTSDATKATVSATGVVTGIAPGPVSITAKANADTLKAGSVTVTVNAPPPAATVDISSITQFGTIFPVNPNNVFGTVDLSVNVNPGGQVVQNLSVLVDGQPVALLGGQVAPTCTSQNSVTGAPAGIVVLSCNTANFNPDAIVVGTNTHAAFINGAHTFAVQACGVSVASGVGCPAASILTTSTALTVNFQNIDGFFARVVNTTPVAPQIASAVDAVGRGWNAGSINVNFVPVLYAVNGARITSVTVNWPCPVGSPGAALQPIPTGTQLIPAENAAGAAIVVSWPVGTAIGAMGSANFNNCDQNAVIEPIIVASLRSDGSPGPAGPFLNSSAFLINSTLGRRVDNLGPTTVNPFTLTVQGGAGSLNGQPDCCAPTLPNFNWLGTLFQWINTGTAPRGAFGFDGVGALPLSFNDFWLAGVSTPIGGVGVGMPAVMTPGVNPTFHVGAAGSTLAQLFATATVNGTETLVPTITPSEYAAAVRYLDRLGNVGSPNFLTDGFFGVDKINPLHTFQLPTATGTSAGNVVTTTPIDQMIWNGANPNPGTRRWYTGSIDSSTAGNTASGFKAGTARLFRVRQNFSVLTTWLNASAGAPSASGIPDSVFVPVAEGYQTYETIVRDQAGNRGLQLSRTILNDVTNPVVTNVAIPPALTAGVNTAFSTNISDNVALGHFFAALDYNAVVPGAFSGLQALSARTTPCTTIATCMVSVGVFGSQIVGPQAAVDNIFFVRSIEATAGVPGVPSGVQTQSTAARITAVDVAGNVSTQFNPFAAGSMPTVGTTAATAGVATFTIAVPALGVCTAAVSGNCSPSGNFATTRVVTITATGPSGTFLNPFAAVDLYIRRAVTPGGSGCALVADCVTRLFAVVGSPAVFDDGITRTWQWTATFNPSTAGFASFQAQAATPLFAMGVRATGEGLLSNTLVMNVQNGIIP